MIFKLQLYPINQKTRRGSCNFVIMTQGNSSTHATHIFLGKVCCSILEQCYSFCCIKVFIRKYFIVSQTVLCWLNTFRICGEGLWIRADILDEVDLKNNIQPVKTTWTIWIQRLKPAFYHISRGLVRDRKLLHITPSQINQFLCIFNEYEIQHFG